MQPGFVDFPNFAQGDGFANRKYIFKAREFKNPTKWDFARAVKQRWLEWFKHGTKVT